MTDDEGSPAITRRGALALGGAAVGGVALAGASAAAEDDGSDDHEDGDGNGNGDGGRDDAARHYRVTIANLTPGQPFTPPAVAAHRADVEVFAVGEPANDPTRELAENGNLDPLLEFAGETDAVRDAAVGQSPLVPEDDPGDTGHPFHTKLHLSADASTAFLTFASMLIATNDGIVGLDTVPLPERVNESMTYYANGYDVGTERNTERFEDLVPPARSLITGEEPEDGTVESDPDLAENGVVRPHPGIQGDGDLDPDVYGWREPAALVQVERLAELQTEFEATLTGEEEVPPVETDATGEASFELDDDEIAFEVMAEDVEDVVAAHIHCGPRGANGPVGVTLFEGDPVSPDGVLAEGTVSAPDEDNDCGWESVDDVVAGLRSGNTYVNVHTEANPAGEIRGQVR